jgi:hypothetical protein
MNVAGLDKAAVVAALYNADFLRRPEPMTTEEARRLLSDADGRLYFNYLFGRALETSFATDEVRTDLYNRDNGEGVAEAVIGILRASGDPAHPDILAIHKKARNMRVAPGPWRAKSFLERE